MYSYLIYYVPVLVQLAAAAGFVAGGDWVFIGIASFPFFALLDSILPDDMSVRRIKSKSIAYIPVWLSTILSPSLYFFAAWQIAQGDLTGWQLAGCALSCAWLGVVPLVPSSHELYHQRSALARFVGHYAQVCYLDCTRDIAHVIGHHIDVATPKDGDTAPRGTSLYAFTGPAIIRSTREAWGAESDALEKRGKGRWSIGHRLYKAIVAQTLFQLAIFLIGGWTALAVGLAGVLIARVWVESFNYFQHYGLIRVEGAPIARRHVWNHLGFFSRVMAYEITNHADHHLDSYQTFYNLVPDSTAIRMPSVFVCFLSALIPPLWHNLIIKPALKRWDNEFASAEERKIAREQNRLAGWPDWFDEAEAGGKPAGASQAA